MWEFMSMKSNHPDIKTQKKIKDNMACPRYYFPQIDMSSYGELLINSAIVIYIAQ